MHKLEAISYRYQNFLGFLLVGVMLSTTLVYLVRTTTPAYAAATDSKGSPNVAIGKFFAKDSSGNTYVKIVYADGHVGDPINAGTISSGTLQCSPLGGGGTPLLNVLMSNPLSGGGYANATAYVIGSDNCIYSCNSNSGAIGPSGIPWGGWGKISVGNYPNGYIYPNSLTQLPALP